MAKFDMRAAMAKNRSQIDRAGRIVTFTGPDEHTLTATAVLCEIESLARTAIPNRPAFAVNTAVDLSGFDRVLDTQGVVWKIVGAQTVSAAGPSIVEVCNG